MKLSFVVPRYGDMIIGGAEHAARMLAEHLVTESGWSVEVLTTTATDHRTWADELPEGVTHEAGVRVVRLRASAGRHRDFEKFSAHAMTDPLRLPPADQERWIEMQGPVCPQVVEAAAASDADAVVFYPYLYYPTVHGVPVVGRRAVVHAAAHDEQPLRLPRVRPVFTKAAGLVYPTWGERRLVESRFPVGATRQIVLGLGIDEGSGDPATARMAIGVGDRPFLLCVGRVDDGKGTRLLAEFFATYKRRRPGPLALVLVGPVVQAPAAHPDVIVTGPVDEAVKWGAMATAAVYVQPSGYESFSLVLLEAWSKVRPALVNGRCAATREHCERSGGGLWFESYAGFEGALDLLLGDPRAAQTMGEAGRHYVETRFRWPELIARYRSFLTKVAAQA